MKDIHGMEIKAYRLVRIMDSPSSTKAIIFVFEFRLQDDSIVEMETEATVEDLFEWLAGAQIPEMVPSLN